jgi:hypothetical protein
MKSIVLFNLMLLYTFNLYATIGIVEIKPSNPGNCDGAISIEATGSAAPFGIIINNGASTEIVFDINGIHTFGNLCPGTYTVTVMNPLPPVFRLKRHRSCRFSMGRPWASRYSCF